MIPDFIGIGAPKAATSWLYYIFKEHPNIWVPPTKELHFFNSLRDEDSHFYNVFFKKKGYKKSINRFRYSPLHKPIWIYKYLFKKRNINSYFKLFTPHVNQISGEITPTYAGLNRDKINRVYSFLPKVKIIYIVRNPIYRNWSALCMKHENALKIDISTQSDETLSEIAADPKRLSNSNYINNLNNWESYYSSDQIFVGFYNEIKDRPINFLQRLFSFLELPKVDMKIFEKHLRQKINSYSQSIPPKVLLAITELEYNNILNAHERFNNQYTAAWLEEAERILEF